MQNASIVINLFLKTEYKIERLNMNWIILFVAGLFETAWAVGLKYSDGFSKPLPSVITIAAMAVSIYLLSLAVKDLPIGTAYAVWTGIGAVGTVIAGIFLFKEPVDLLRILFIAMIIGGILGLRMTYRG